MAAVVPGGHLPEVHPRHPDLRHADHAVGVGPLRRVCDPPDVADDGAPARPGVLDVGQAVGLGQQHRGAAGGVDEHQLGAG
ncbi:MAG: hypothetical protein ACK559_05335, partial [bacterium]